MVRAIIIAYFVMFCTSLHADISSIYTDYDFQKKVLAGDDLKVVMFTAPWCHYCHKLKPVMKKLSSKYKIYTINTDNLDSISDEYHINYLPSILLFKNGKEVDRISGYTTEKNLIATFDKKIK